MPELPEAETISRQIREYVTDQKIVSVSVHRDRAIRSHCSEQDFADKILGATIITSGRRGKAILLPLSSDKTIIIRLGMSGSLYIKTKDDMSAPVKHTHVILKLESGNELHFVDPRTFGEVAAVNGKNPDDFPQFKDYGYEPLSDDFNAKTLLQLCENKNSSIEAILMEQKNVVGIGKIYSDESLFLAEIDPRRAAKTITKKEAETLVNVIKQVLANSIESRGTSGKDGAYRDAFGNHGTFATKLNVYQREGKPCNRCGTIVEFTPFQGRRMHYCPHCQK